MLHLYNSKTRQKELFSPINDKFVRLYVCGPTIYADVHIGNARPFIVYDLLFRLLRRCYGPEHVIYIRNLTDIDDKINARAQQEFPELPINSAIAILTKTTNDRFQEDIKALNCLEPTKQPRASHYVEEIRLFIDRLLKQNHAYIAQDHVLFSVKSMPEAYPYGRLSQKPFEEMRAGARVEVASYKRDAMDFVLWKPSLNGEPAWPSPGNISVEGRPGWHIECSVMSMAELLVPFGGGFNAEQEKNSFDIHAGGIDLLFPHHENEMAQSCCALKTPMMANYWLHNGFLLIDGHKMSKSMNNFLTIHDLLSVDIDLPFTKPLLPTVKKLWIGLSIRLAMLQTHYRNPLNWTLERFSKASEELYRWYKKIYQASLIDSEEIENLSAFFEALYDDLNTPLALSGLRLCYNDRDYMTLKSGLEILGLWPNPEDKSLIQALFETPHLNLNEEEILTKIQTRSEFLLQKSWQEADKIRDELLQLGVQLQDEKDPITKERVTKWSYI